MSESADGLMTPFTRQKGGMPVTVADGETATEPFDTIVAVVIVVPPSTARPARAAHSTARPTGAAVVAGVELCAETPRVASSNAAADAPKYRSAIESLPAWRL